jgi:hypothetical protein
LGERQALVAAECWNLRFAIFSESLRAPAKISQLRTRLPRFRFMETRCSPPSALTEPRCDAASHYAKHREGDDDDKERKRYT